MGKLAAFDIETTGLDRQQDRIIELALATEEAVYSWLIQHPGLTVSEETTSITGITQEMIDSDGMPLDRAWGEFCGLIAGNYVELIGHNALRFDWPFIEEECRRYGWAPPVVEIKDTAAVFKGLCMGLWPSKPHKEWANRVLDARIKGLQFNLARAAQVMGLEIPPDTHRAGVDAGLTLQLAKKLYCLFPTKRACQCGFRGGYLVNSATEATVKCVLCGASLEKVSLQESVAHYKRTAPYAA